MATTRLHRLELNLAFYQQHHDAMYDMHKQAFQFFPTLLVLIRVINRPLNDTQQLGLSRYHKHSA